MGKALNGSFDAGLVNLSRLVCQSLFFGLNFCHVEFFLTLEGCSSYSIRRCNKGLLANI